MELRVEVVLAIAAFAVLALWWQQRSARLRFQRQITPAHARAGQLQQDLEKQARLLQASLAVTSELLLIVDRDLHLLLANASAKAFFGEPPTETTLISYTRSLELERLVLDALRGSGDTEGLERTLRLNHSLFRARAVSMTEGIAAVALTDISEMQRLTRARQDMVANLSHELRTPLTSLRLLADTLLTPAASDAGVAHDLARKIAAEVDVLQQMTSEMLDLAAIESGQQVVRLVPTSLEAIVSQALARLADEAARRGVGVGVGVPSELTVLADREQASRAVLNVLHNAIKFSRAGSIVRVDAGVDRSQGKAILAIRDSGPGIAPEDLDRVFERFYRGNQSRGTPGTGLGLAIARHILRAHGGRIWAQNAVPPESGAVFYLEFGTA